MIRLSFLILVETTERAHRPVANAGPTLNHRCDPTLLYAETSLDRSALPPWTGEIPSSLLLIVTARK